MIGHGLLPTLGKWARSISPNDANYGFTVNQRSTGGLLDLQAAGVSKFTVGNDGTVTLTAGLITSTITGTAAATSLTIKSHVTGGAAAQRDILLQTGNAANPQVAVDRLLLKSNAAQGSAGIAIYESLLFDRTVVSALVNDSAGAAPASAQIYSSAAGVLDIASGGGNNVAAVKRISLSNAATAVMTLSSLTVTGIVLSGALDSNAQNITGLRDLYGDAADNHNIYANAALTDATARTLSVWVLDSTADAWLEAQRWTPDIADPWISTGYKMHIGAHTEPSDMLQLSVASGATAIRIVNIADQSSVLRFLESTTSKAFIQYLSPTHSVGAPRAGNLEITTVSGTEKDIDIRANDVSCLYVKSGGNIGIGTSTFGTNAATVLAIANGTAPTTAVANSFQMWSADINGAAGYAGPHFIVETNAVALIVCGVYIKTNTGTVANPFEGLMEINTFDNTVKIYADGAWRTLASGW